MPLRSGPSRCILERSGTVSSIPLSLGRALPGRAEQEGAGQDPEKKPSRMQAVSLGAQVQETGPAGQAAQGVIGRVPVGSWVPSHFL